MKVLYVAIVSAFIRWVQARCLKLGRAVEYTHGGRLYMTRYALWGHLTGDAQRGLRSWLPNLYVHQMHAPDLDPSLHDHPWPWAVSFIMLGGYVEERNVETPACLFQLSKWRGAPGLNFLSGSTFHRIAALSEHTSTWTLFLAGPRAGRKQWGYIVEGAGYVSHQTRHFQIEGKEIRLNRPEDIFAAKFVFGGLKPATGKALDSLGAVLGLERRKRCRWFGLLSESDKNFRQRMHDFACSLAGCP